MKKLVKIISMTTLSALCLLSFTFAACGNTNSTADWQYLQDKKTIVIGITEFAPMNYYENGKLVGFDTEFAEALCKKLGLTPEFKIIDWNSKVLELESKNIDVVWNGLTYDEERAENMDLTQAYLKNKGVLVAKKSSAFATQTTAFDSNVRIAVEQGSTAAKNVVALSNTKNATVTSVETGAQCFLEVKNGSSDIAYVDFLQARYMITSPEYSDLTFCDMEVENTYDAYCIALRKNSPMTLKKFNSTIDALILDGTLATISNKYFGNTDLLV